MQDAVRSGADAVVVGDLLKPVRRTRSPCSRCSPGSWRRRTPGASPWCATPTPPARCGVGHKKGSTESVLYASRAYAAELGTDIVKTWYTGSTAEFAKVVEGTPAIVVAAGGAPANSPLDVLKQATSVVEAGAHGMTAGRNIWQAPDPGKMVAALKAVIHGGDSPEGRGQAAGLTSPSTSRTVHIAARDPRRGGFR